MIHKNAQNGHDIRGIGLNENEVLFERNSKFKVQNKMFVDNIWNIWLKEV